MWNEALEVVACRLAKAAIVGCITDGEVPDSSLSSLTAMCLEDPLYHVFRNEGASFVTLEKHGSLRGCVGTLLAHRPLVHDLIENAVASATRDPRFRPVELVELDDLTIALSILSQPEALDCTDESSLLAVLRPGVDGLILEYGAYRSTYLPSVWSQLPDPEHFLRELKAKAGLPDDFWHADIRFSRYGVHYIQCGDACDIGRSS